MTPAVRLEAGNGKVRESPVTPQIADRLANLAQLLSTQNVVERKIIPSEPTVAKAV
jgi:hypothetical protein